MFIVLIFELYEGSISIIKFLYFPILAICAAKTHSVNPVPKIQYSYSKSSNLYSIFSSSSSLVSIVYSYFYYIN
jgi:hypothetical protein